jgi:hypothetical protein
MFKFRRRDRTPPVLPSDIRKAWENHRQVFQIPLHGGLVVLDPAYHPASKNELRSWITQEVESIAQQQDNQTSSNTSRGLQDCDDSAFNLKSSASGYRQSPLAAPLCVGVMLCRTVAGTEHVVNWFVSADREPSSSTYNVICNLWFCDVQALVRKQRGLDLPKSVMTEALVSPNMASWSINSPVIVLI